MKIVKTVFAIVACFLVLLQTAEAACFTPANLTDSKLNGTIKLDWNDANTSKYEVFYRSVPLYYDPEDSDWLPVFSIFQVTNNSNLDIAPGTLPNVKYEFKVRSVCGKSKSAFSGTIDVLTDDNIIDPGDPDFETTVAPNTGGGSGSGGSIKFAITESKLGNVIDTEFSRNKQVAFINTSQKDGQASFDLVFQPKDSRTKSLFFKDLSLKMLQNKADELKRQNFSLLQLTSYRSRGEVKYAAVFQQQGRVQTFFFTNYSPRAHQNKIKEMARQGYHLAAVNATRFNGKYMVCGVYHRFARSGR